MAKHETYLAAAGNFKRVVAIRLKPKTDLLLELEKACREYNIQNGVIVSGIGGVTRAAICDPQFFPERKQPYNYGDPIILDLPLSISGVSGIICHDDEGTINLHVHISFSDGHGNCYAGHLVEGTQVMLTADLVIAEVDGFSMSRKYDEELEVPLFCPEQK